MGLFSLPRVLSRGRYLVLFGYGYVPPIWVGFLALKFSKHGYDFNKNPMKVGGKWKKLEKLIFFRSEKCLIRVEDVRSKISSLEAWKVFSLSYSAYFYS